MAIAGALLFSAAAASSLGTFDDVPFDAMADDLTPCTYDSVTLLDGTLNLLTGTLLATSELDTVELSNVSGDCIGKTPVVVVQGVDLLDLAAGEQVLHVVDGLDPLSTTGNVTLTVDPPVLIGDSVDLRESRVAFCPEGRTCT